jgi:hypothetical protein
MVTLLRLHVLRYVLNETMARRESPTDSLEEGSVSLSAIGLDSRISTGGRRRRGGEPEPDEESKGLRRDSQVTLTTFGTTEAPAVIFPAVGARHGVDELAKKPACP